MSKRCGQTRPSAYSAYAERPPGRLGSEGSRAGTLTQSQAGRPNLTTYILTMGEGSHRPLPRGFSSWGAKVLIAIENCANERHEPSE